MATGVCNNAFRTTTICVDCYENDALCGRFYNPYMENGKEFKSLMQLILKIEQMLDDMDFPRSFTQKRTFADSPAARTDLPAMGIQQGELATFDVRIIFRRNSSWQGSIFWLEWGEEQSFRSVLELIYLIDNAISKAKKQVS